MSLSSSRVISIVISALLSFQPGLCIGALPGAFATGPDEQALSRIFDRFASIERGLVNLDQLEARLALEHADPLERSRALGGDPEAITADVADNIAYLPYGGSLRAAAGTLASRSGNAIDQAVLLATMLNRTGLEARIVRAEIDEDDAMTLLESAAPAPAGKPAFSEADMKALRQEIGADLPDLAKTFSNGSAEDRRAQWRQDIAAQQQRLSPRSVKRRRPRMPDCPLGWLRRLGITGGSSIATSRQGPGRMHTRLGQTQVHPRRLKVLTRRTTASCRRTAFNASRYVSRWRFKRAMVTPRRSNSPS